ncbi:radical SAM protein [Tritonibacter litoralis]|uniref:radical SAM protein n=1 Tax=Tritonibacter litoralis TaxID=2662264 RepID=UPI001884F0ED
MNKAMVFDSKATKHSPFAGSDQRRPLQSGLQEAGQYHELQTAGRFYPVACVALEITQRCNLDCTLCYLSEHAEQAKDVPLELLLHRVDEIWACYGAGTTIQITGGDPTLRPIADIEVLCRRIKQLGLRSCLMTNGIRASRLYLKRLAEAELDDVAFHVDMTQERNGFHSELDLNALRHQLIEDARGLGLRILFNTTVFQGNLDEIPMLCRFFAEHAKDLSLVSFQMQAETGRGHEAPRDDALTQARVAEQISKGFGASFPSAVGIGHSDCGQYDHLLVAGGQAVSVLENTTWIARVVRALAAADTSGHAVADIRQMVLSAGVRNPGLALRGLLEGIRALWQIRRGIWQAKGQVARLSVMIHSFMDASALDADRCASCVFMVMTQDGPLSMCAYNAERDHYLFAPQRMASTQGHSWWNAATGAVTPEPTQADLQPPAYKHMKGRMRVQEAKRRKEKAL